MGLLDSLGGLFNSPQVKYQNVGGWPGYSDLQSGLMSSATGGLSGLSSLLGSSEAYWQNLISGKQTDPLKDPYLMGSINSILGQAKQDFPLQQQQQGTQFINSGNAFSSARQQANARLWGQQQSNLQSQLMGALLPYEQQQKQMQMQASQMPMSLTDMFRSLATAGGGQYVQQQYGQSPFSQLLGAAEGAYKAFA